jgi:uncharacterized damage-inducible protein DinB
MMNEPSDNRRRKDMTLKCVSIVCALLLCIPSLNAQSGSPAPDPISGTWTGWMGRDESQKMPITVAFERNGAVMTGVITGPPHPGKIRSGTFDPATGALKFEVVVQDDAQTIVVFEGKVSGDAAAGRVSFNNQTGIFNITRKAAAGPTGTGSNARMDPGLAAVRGRFGEVSQHVIRAADLVPADKYTFRPTASVRTFGEQIAHIADAYNYFCTNASGKKVEWSEATEKGSLDKATLTQKLKQATDACWPAYSGSGQLEPLLQNVTHANLHYGNIVTYMRMLGLVPPSS